MQELIITGASGFLGSAVVEAGRKLFPNARIHAITSSRNGGIDLARQDAVERLKHEIQISNPEQAVLIHAAAVVEFEESERVLTENQIMTLNIARWSRDAGLGFSLLVSTVNVYGETSRIEAVDASIKPSSLYGIGKLAAEHVWRIFLPEQQRATVRLAGIWGWQKRPTMFWNRLLQAAAYGSQSPPIVRRGASFRNYISAPEASECLLQIGTNKLPGLFLGAGRDTVDTRSFVSALEKLPSSRLAVEWKDDGGSDQQIFIPSPELLPYLKPFPTELASLWQQRPKERD